MKYRTLFLSCCLALATVATSSSLLAEKPAKTETTQEGPKPKIMLDFRKVAQEYAYDQWDKKVNAVQAGLLVDAPSGKGGFGANNLTLDIDGSRFVEIALYTLDGNEMKAVSVNLVDLFGSEVTWEIRIDQITPLTAVWFRLKLADGTLNLKGKRHTFDYTDIKGYQIKGDWGDKPAQFAIVGVRARKE